MTSNFTLWFKIDLGLKCPGMKRDTGREYVFNSYWARDDLCVLSDHASNLLGKTGVTKS